MKLIYLDNAATTPMDKKVFEAMKPYFCEEFGNASSLHNFGEKALEAVEKARKDVVDFFGADEKEIIFTSGATESNNLAIKGVVKYFWTRNVQNGHFVSTIAKPHIIISSFEHHSVLNTAKDLEREGLAEVSFINPKKDGVMAVQDIKSAIKSNTILVSIMQVNNEIGTVQPIAEIGKMIKKCDSNIIFHTDATQAAAYFDCNVNKLGVDMLSLSAHKIYGPKGVGALYVKKGTPIRKIQDGGSQEKGLRAGTLNVPGIVGLAAAILGIKKNKNKKIEKLRNYLIKKILKNIPDTKLNGSKIKRSPANANFSFKNIEGESLIIMLNAQGVACSTGSACSSGSLSPSHALIALGMKPEEAHGSLRITLGKYTTKKEIDFTIKVLKNAIEKLRKISGKVLEEFYKSN